MLDFLLLVILILIVWGIVTLIVKGLRRLFRGAKKES